MRVRVEAKAVAMQQLEYLNAFKIGFVEAPDRSYVASKPFASYEQAQSHLLDIAYQYVAKSDKRTFSEMEAEILQGYLRIGSVVAIILREENNHERRQCSKIVSCS